MEFAGAQFVAACVLVFGVLGALWLYAKRGTLPMTRQAGRHMHVEETLFLDARHKLVRVRHGQEFLLILIGPQGAQTIPTPCEILPTKESNHA